MSRVDPITYTFEAAAKNVIGRTVTTGRPVSLDYLGDAHYHAQETFLQLARELGDRAKFKVLFNDGALTDIKERSLDELQKKSYANFDETAREESAEKRSAQEALRRLRDQGGERSAGPAVQRGREKESRGVAAGASERGVTESLLGRVGTAEERQSALTEHFAQAINAAYRAGEIDTAQYRALRFGDAAHPGERPQQPGGERK